MSRLWQTEFSGFLGVPEPSNVEFAVTSTCTAPSITQSFPGEAVHFGMNLALRTVVLASNCGAQLDFHSILSNFLKSNSETELLTVSMLLVESAAHRTRPTLLEQRCTA
jgi:hypothetical protein